MKKDLEPAHADSLPPLHSPAVASPIDPMELMRDRASKAYVWATANQLPPHTRLDDAAIPEIVRQHFEKDVPLLMAEIAWLRDQLAKRAMQEGA